MNPLNVESLATLVVPADTLGIIPTPDQLTASTINISQLICVLRSARRRKGEASSMEAFSNLTQIYVACVHVSAYKPSHPQQWGYFAH